MFDGNHHLENCLDWVQFMEMIFERKEYNDENVFTLATLMMKEDASIWYEKLNWNTTKEAKSKIKTWS